MNIKDLKQKYKYEDWGDSDYVKGTKDVKEIEKDRTNIPTLLANTAPISLTSAQQELVENNVSKIITFLATEYHFELPQASTKFIQLSTDFINNCGPGENDACDLQLQFDCLFEFTKELFSIHIPLYKKAFEIFDSLQAQNNPPLEVYIGRDSFYAFAARESIWSVKPFSAKPVYIVYPRIFIKLLSTQQKIEYLASLGITKESNPVVFDLCYNGTVPEDILTTLGYSVEETNERIFMLSAKNPQRQFSNISNDYARVVADMQYFPKKEARATGIKRVGNSFELIAQDFPAGDIFLSNSLEYLVRGYFKSLTR